MLQWIEYIIDNHQYLAYLVLFVGTFLEGETILIIGGFLAHDGQPNIVLVILSAFAGSLSGDQTWFFVGRYRGKAILANRPLWQEKANRVFRLLERFHTLLILGFRFLYGLRNVTPFALGMSEVKTSRFVILNTIGAAVWATTFGMGGFLFGRTIETMVGKIKKEMFAGLCVVALVAWIVRICVRRRKARKMATPTLPPPGEGGGD